MGLERRNNRREAQQWEKIIEGYGGSGLSVKGYCQQSGISDNSYYRWRKRLKKKLRQPEKDFIKVTVGSENRREAIRIKTPGGYCLEVEEGTAGGFVKDILAALVSQ